MTNEEIRKLRRQYPTYITKEQMYRICHISKRACLFLLESGLVPCQDSHKKTRRFNEEKLAELIKTNTSNN